MVHFLDENGNIPDNMPKPARELGSFLGLVVDATTRFEEKVELRCRSKRCKGIIQSTIVDNGDIHYWCTHCEKYNGIISEWEGTKFDMSNVI